MSSRAAVGPVVRRLRRTRPGTVGLLVAALIAAACQSPAARPGAAGPSPVTTAGSAAAQADPMVPDVPPSSASGSPGAASGPAAPGPAAPGPASSRSAPPAVGSTAPISGPFYVNPRSPAALWVAAHRDDPRADVIGRRIAGQPAASWFADGPPAQVGAAVTALVGPAGPAVPVIATDALPNRDCGGDGSGEPDLTSYAAWIDGLAAGLGSHPAMVLLEPGGLAMQECLSPADTRARDAALARAVTTIKQRDPAARVYLDGGHSNWNPAADQATRLKAAGVAAADGFFTNAENFNRTADEVTYAKNILARLGGTRLRVLIDTSRNGNGPGPSWCDPAGRALGVSPSRNTGDPAIEAYLWIKNPGEADGCAAAANTFQPDLAFRLATG
jgi:endoglucanase